jgi:hypothetical protein
LASFSIETEDLEKELFDFLPRNLIFTPPFLKKSQLLQVQFSRGQSLGRSSKPCNTIFHRGSLVTSPRGFLKSNRPHQSYNPLFPWVRHSLVLTDHELFHEQAASMDLHMVMVVPIAVDFLAMPQPCKQGKLVLLAPSGVGELVVLMLIPVTRLQISILHNDC